jgi:hypothetical protein
VRRNAKPCFRTWTAFLKNGTSSVVGNTDPMRKILRRLFLVGLLLAGLMAASVHQQI